MDQEVDAFKLRPYQKDCIESVLTELKTKNKVGIVMPCGAGKTEVFCEVTRGYLSENPDKMVLVLSHLSILTTQTKARFALRTPELKIGVLQADIEPSPDSQVVISTMQSARVEDKIINWLSGGSVFHGDKRTVGLIIVDEMHYLTTNSYEKALSYFKDAKVLGCTATPYREGQLMTNWFDCIAFSISIKDLIEQGYLVEPKLNQIVTETTLTDEDRMARVTDLYLRQEKGQKAIVFLKTIEDSKTMSSVMVDHGVKCKTITSDLENDTRDEALEDFRNGDTEVLTTCNVLSHGFDAPCLQVIFMPYATTSPTLYLQRIGRALRLFPGKQNARIYAFGEAPSIRRGLYEKVQDLVLLGGRVDTTKEICDIYDELEYMKLNGDTKSEQYIYTRRVVTIADRIKQLGMVGLHKLIISKQFPSRFLSSDMFLKNLHPRDATTMTNGNLPLTQKQIQTLTIAGFTKAQIMQMNRSDGAYMIATVNTMRKNALEGTSDILPSGVHMGKRVKDTPWYYRRWVLANQPHSVVSKMIRKFGGM
jgi:superfamily II DNA or RNA helicase